MGVKIIELITLFQESEFLSSLPTNIKLCNSGRTIQELAEEVLMEAWSLLLSVIKVHISKQNSALSVKVKAFEKWKETENCSKCS